MKRTIFIASFLALGLSACSSESETTPAEKIVPAQEAEVRNEYTIDGDFGDHYYSGTVILTTRNPDYVEPEKPKTDGQGGASMAATGMGATSMGAASMGGEKAAEIPLEQRRYIEVARAEIHEGKYEIQGTIDEPIVAYVGLENQRGKNGERWGATKGLQFILEPGDLVLTQGDGGRYLHVAGGKYNDIIFNSWRDTDEYQALVAKDRELGALAYGENDLTDDEKDAASDAYSANFSARIDMENNARKVVATTHDNVKARILAVKSAPYGGDWMQEAYFEIVAMDPSNEWAQEQLENWSEHVRLGNAQSRIKEAINFEAVDLDGNTVSLADARANSKYLLLEFWASWCGPCRAEIPHMKQAYSEYNSKGFEIFSFTIDDYKEDWAIASEDEELPWIDTGFGGDAEQKELYKVTGVPANFLINSETGEIVGMHVRGRKLEKQLHELFDAS